MIKAVLCALFGHRPDFNIFFTVRQKSLDKHSVLRPCTRCPVYIEVLKQ